MSQRDNSLDCIKGLAIISVICAHCNTVFNSSSIFANTCSLLLQNIGNFGVICFMVISGMLFRIPTGKAKQFWLKKLKSIFIPWIISGTCIWLYVFLRKPPLTLNSWANFLIGNGSYLYYLSVLMLFYGIFSLPFMHTKTALFLCEAVTSVSALWFYRIGNLPPYLNPLNWIGFFALGIRIMQLSVNVPQKRTKLWQKYIIWSLSIILLALQVLGNDGGFYFGGLRAITSWAGAGAFAFTGIALCQYKQTKLSAFLQYIGKNSFFIYIWHMPFAGIVARVMSVGLTQYAVLLRPIIVLAVVIVVYKLADALLRKLKWEKLGFLIGINR